MKKSKLMKALVSCLVVALAVVLTCAFTAQHYNNTYKIPWIGEQPQYTVTGLTATPSTTDIGHTWYGEFTVDVFLRLQLPEGSEQYKIDKIHVSERIEGKTAIVEFFPVLKRTFAMKKSNEIDFTFKHPLRSFKGSGVNEYVVKCGNAGRRFMVKSGWK